MIILTDPIETFTFEKVVLFCKEANVEGVQLEYKQDLSSPRGLSRQFASMCNSRGGVIIIGVVEDKVGKPAQFDGVPLDGKMIDRIHQYATNVDPRPSYEVHHTNEVNGKVFILIRIYEGGRLPYYVQNDPSLYIRTGNITDPIGLASPETTELLFRKKDRAELARKNNLDRSIEVYKSAVLQADKERLAWVASEKSKYLKQVEQAKAEGSPIPKEPMFIGKLGTQVSMLTLTIQPFFPYGPLVLPRVIKDRVQEIRFTSRMGDYPDLNLRPIQDGLLNFEWGHNGAIDCQELYSNGLLYFAQDVLRPDDGVKKVYISHIAADLFVFLKAASLFYTLAKYQGSLIGSVKLEGIDGARLIRIVPNRWRPGAFWDDEKEVPVMDKYEWSIDINTSTLHDQKALQNYFIEFIREIYWSLGYEDAPEELLKAFLTDVGLLV